MSDKQPYGKPLNFPFSYVLKLEQSNTYDFVSNNDKEAIVDENWFVVSLQRNEYVKALSAIQAGYDIAYPDVWQDLIMPFLEALVEFPNEIPGNSYMKFCQLMSNCFQAIADTPYNELTPGQKALYQSFVNASNSIASGDPNAPLPPSNAENFADGCTDDNLFALATQTTDFLNKVMEDMVDKLELVATIADLLRELADNYSFVQELAASTADFANWLIDFMLEFYESEYTTATRDRIRCDLYCIAKENCSLTIADMIEYFAVKVGITIVAGDDTLLNIAEEVSDTTQALVVDATTLMMLVFVNAGASFAGLTKKSLLASLKTFGNDSDPDHTICDNCGWTQCITFADSALWSSTENFAQQDESGRFNAVSKLEGDGDWAQQLSIEFTVPSGAETIKVINYDAVIGTLGGSPVFSRLRYNFDTSPKIDETLPTGTGLTYTSNVPSNAIGNMAQIFLRVAFETSPPPEPQDGVAKVTRIEITGKGTPPPDLGTCP